MAQQMKYYDMVADRVGEPSYMQEHPMGAWCRREDVAPLLVEENGSSHNISRDAMSRLMEAPVRSDDTRHPY